MAHDSSGLARNARPWRLTQMTQVLAKNRSRPVKTLIDLIIDVHKLRINHLSINPWQPPSQLQK
jgi:hypothetical protein